MQNRTERTQRKWKKQNSRVEGHRRRVGGRKSEGKNKSKVKFRMTKRVKNLNASSNTAKRDLKRQKGKTGDETAMGQ